MGVGNSLKFAPAAPNYKMKDIVRKKYQTTGVAGIAGHIRVLSIGGQDCLERVGFKDVKTVTTGYLPFWGRLSDFFVVLIKDMAIFWLLLDINNIISI